MKDRLRFDYTHALTAMREEELSGIKTQVMAAKELLLSGKGAGHDFLGWVDLPVQYDKEEYARMQAAAKEIQSHSDALVVIGIGGSYLGARAVIEFLQSCFAHEDKNAAFPAVYFAGNSFSAAYLQNLVEVLKDKDFSVNVISKSGTTTEPAIAFRVFRSLLEGKYGKDGAARRIYATTDKAHGALKTLAEKEGYETFVVPDAIGGRYSVLTAVGLLPIMAGGISTEALLAGAAAAREAALQKPFEENDALLYAAVRHILLRKGKQVEILANYEPFFHYVAEWWKQLFGESEGKDQKGIFPASVDLTTDLHSMGQFMQDGARILFETVLSVREEVCSLSVEPDAANLDGLNYLAGKTLDFVNKNAMKGTVLAHMDGGLPVLGVEIPRRDATSLGELLYFFEFACGISGYLLGVNPFDQPGVESYKKNMFALLGKPGYEKEQAALLKRLS